ncbi:hypothetical protein BCV70DRAFT_227720 [Testicularia cyperi]|uniref:Methyl methanesulfonate-sensitivity protein 22 n=1 Tax=Testicularia cyperi TaxID=1882483 RepID=A0A317XLD5_9BASI|nr:hypothetical protein BCV70DRAFT_227720 [Testicularia cyperi]
MSRQSSPSAHRQPAAVSPWSHKLPQSQQEEQHGDSTATSSAVHLEQPSYIQPAVVATSDDEERFLLSPSQDASGFADSCSSRSSSVADAWPVERQRSSDEAKSEQNNQEDEVVLSVQQRLSTAEQIGSVSKSPVAQQTSALGLATVSTDLAAAAAPSTRNPSPNTLSRSPASPTPSPRRQTLYRSLMDRDPSSSPPLPLLKAPRRHRPTSPQSSMQVPLPSPSPSPTAGPSNIRSSPAQSTLQNDEAVARATAALPPTPPRRQLRERKAQQLNPYTLEAMRYQRTLIRNDWQDAVVSQREWHRQERRRIAEEEAKARKESESNSNNDETQSQWLVNSSGPSSEVDPDESVPASSQGPNPTEAQHVVVELPLVRPSPPPPRSRNDTDNAVVTASVDVNGAGPSRLAPRTADTTAVSIAKKTYRSHAKASAMSTAQASINSSSPSMRRRLLGESSTSSDSDAEPNPATGTNEATSSRTPVERGQVALSTPALSHSASKEGNGLIQTARHSSSPHDVMIIDSSEDERPLPPATLRGRPRRSRWSGDGSSSDSTDYERRFRQLKKMMPAGMARRHIRDLRAMRHGKAYHPDGHVSSASSDGGQGDTTISPTRPAIAETPTTSPLDANGELRPGETRKRLRRHDSLEGRDALLLDPNSDSSSSDASLSSIATASAAAGHPSTDSGSDTDAKVVAWWTSKRHVEKASHREKDAIDRMLSRTARSANVADEAARSKAKSRGGRQEEYRPDKDYHRSWQPRLDNYVGGPATAGPSRDIDRNGGSRARRKTHVRGDDATTITARLGVAQSESRRMSSKKKRKMDPRVGQTKYSHAGPPLNPRNPPTIRPRTRPRLDLQLDEVLFIKRPHELDPQKNQEDARPIDDESTDDVLLLLGDANMTDVSLPAVDPRLAQPRRAAARQHQSSHTSPRGLPVLDGVPGSPSSPSTRSMDRGHAGLRMGNAAAVASPQSPVHALIPVGHRDAEADMAAEHWDDFEGIRTDFGISPLSAGAALRMSSFLFREGYLSELIKLPDKLVQGQALHSIWSEDSELHVGEVVLTMRMEHDVLHSTLPLLLDQIRMTIDSRTQGSDTGHGLGTRKYLAETFAFLGTWLTTMAMQSTDEAACTFRTYRAIMSRLELLQQNLAVSASSVHIRMASLHICWSRFELCWRALAVVDMHPSYALETDAPTVDELLALSRTLMSLLLYHGLHRSIRALRQASRSGGSLQDRVEHRDEDGNAAAQMADARADGRQDESAAMWIGVIHLLGSFEKGRGVNDCALFWSQFMLAFDKWDSALKQRASLVRSESLWYCLFGLSALSQITPDCQILSRHAGLRQCWNLVVKAISHIQLRLEEKVETRMSWVSITKRDRYVRVVLQRCCLLATEWGWSMEGADSTLARLFDIFNSHRLSDLPSEDRHDFPAFLRDFNISKLELDSRTCRDEEANREPCYHLFIRLLARAGRERRDLSADPRDGDKSIARLLSRMTPVRVMPFTRKNVPTSSERAVLFNHYTVVMLFLHLVPSSSTQRLRQIQSFLPSFKDADFWSQVTSIRAMMYVAVIFRHHHLEMTPVTKWLGETMETLLREYTELERTTGQFERQQQQKQARGQLDRAEAPAKLASVFENAPARQAALKRQQEVTRLLVVALRSTQHIIRHANLESGGGSEKRLPDLHLLHLSWTKHLLEAQLAIEPLLGQEALKCIQTFLLERIKVLEPFQPKPLNAVSGSQNPAGDKEESQDSFADLFAAEDEFDFEDPLLMQLLDGHDDQSRQQKQTSPDGTNPDLNAGAASTQKAWDRAFADYVKEIISPSLFQLLSNIYHPDRRAETGSTGGGFSLGVTERLDDDRFASIDEREGRGSGSVDVRQRMAQLLKAAERRKYLELVVDCWAGCGHVLVTNGLRDWTSYLGFGNESWKRIDDPIGRRDVGLRFLQNVVSLDPAAACKRECESEMIAVWIQTAVARVLSIQDIYTLSLIQAGLGAESAKMRATATATTTILLSDLARRWSHTLQSTSTDDQDSTCVISTSKLDLDRFVSLRSRLLQATFASLASASGGIVYPAVSALLSSIRVYLDDTPSHATHRDYVAFCQQTLEDLRIHLANSPLFGSLRPEFDNTSTAVHRRDAAMQQQQQQQQQHRITSPDL